MKPAPTEDRGVFGLERLGVEMIRWGLRIGVNSCLSLNVSGVVFVSQIWGNERYSGVSEFTKLLFTKLLMCMGFRREGSRGGGIKAMGRCQ